MREDLIEAVGTVPRLGRLDQLVIESTCISEPMPVAVAGRSSADPTEPLQLMSGAGGDWPQRV
jgi:G3E family GTPase